MSLLFRVVFANECTSTHHKLALDALQHLRDPRAHVWRDLFLFHFDAYLDGSKAPDTKFKDFRNHVLHVQEGFWGGAIELGNHWYGETVQLLREKKWRDAVYAAGVLSHYYTDPLMPFHTGQSEEETQIHRAVEWSITKSYDQLRELLINQLGGYPEVEAPQGDDWLASMVKQGARRANSHYQMIIDHYDFSVGVKDPPAAMDQEIKDAIAKLLGHAVVGFARVLDRAFDDSAVEPPQKSLTMGGYLAMLTVPIAWVERKLADGRDRAIVKAMYGEFQKNGRVRETMPEDDRIVRQLHAEEVLKQSLSDIEGRELQPIGSKFGTGKASRQPENATNTTTADRSATSRETNHVTAKSEQSKPAAANIRTADRLADSSNRPSSATGPKFYLEPNSDLVDAPSIGNKTARRFQAIGVRTVADFLAGDAAKMAARLKTGWLTEETIRDWQSQAALVCQISGLRGHDAQLLVACGHRTPAQVALADAAKLHTAVIAYCGTPNGQRILRDGAVPDLGEVRNWIRFAQQARPAQAA